jgi:hypothetical protein
MFEREKALLKKTSVIRDFKEGDEELKKIQSIINPLHDKLSGLINSSEPDLEAVEKSYQELLKAFEPYSKMDIKPKSNPEGSTDEKSSTNLSGSQHTLMKKNKHDHNHGHSHGGHGHSHGDGGPIKCIIS